jgi:hypothetical protein
MKNLVKIPSQKILRVFKTLRIYTVLLPLVGGWGAVSCSLFTDPEPELPPATQIGANTIGFKVNGKVWVPKDEGEYPPNTANNPLLAGFTNYKSFIIDADRMNIEGEKDSFLFIEFPNFNETRNPDIISIVYRQTSIGSWSASNKYPYKFEITKLDTINKICSGTFYFTGVDRNGSTVEITEGRFDVKYKK